MFARWFMAIRTYFALVGAAAFLTAAGSLILILLVSIGGLGTSFSTFVWLCVFLLPVGFVFGSLLLARAQVIDELHTLTRLLVGYVGYILIMMLMFAFGLYSRPDVWVPVIILVLLALLLMAPSIEAKGDQLISLIKRDFFQFNKKDGSSEQRSLFSEHGAAYMVGATENSNEKQR